MALTDYRQLLAYSDAEFRGVDPVVSNLLVARSIPALAKLEIPRYQWLRDEWVAGIQAWLPTVEAVFHRSPDYFRDDINFFRLGMVHRFLEEQAGIEYKEDQRNVTAVRYTDPSDLFLNGVMDTRRGTCGSMAALYVAIGWRLGWPVGLACAKSHYLCRYDDGVVAHNLEATQSGYGGFSSPPDDYLVERFDLPRIAVDCGSDLRLLTPRETLGVFVGLRGRHMRDTGRLDESHSDYLLARWLYPTSRRFYIDAMARAVPYSERLFDPGEGGSPYSLCEMLIQTYGWPGTGYPLTGSIGSTTFASH